MRHQHTYGVVIPYSSNLRKFGETVTGEARLSFYSSFALNVALELYEDGKFDKFVLVSDATFGGEKKSTGLLMKEALLRARTVRPIYEASITLLDGVSLNNTPAQIKALTAYQRKNSFQCKPFLLIDWRFHDERIRHYMRGFGLNADTISVETAHQYYNPKFQLEKLQKVLPKAFDRREKKLRMLARIDKRGFIPRFLKRLTGPVVTDIKKISGADKTSPQGKAFHLELETTTGKAKLRL